MHVFAKYLRYTSIGMGVMNNFRNLNADFEILTQTLRSRSRSQGSKSLHAWKGLVLRHVCANYLRYTSIGMGVMTKFQSLNADFET